MILAQSKACLLWYNFELMKELFVERLAGVTNLNQVKDAVVATALEVREREDTSRLGYVSGIVGSDGPEHMQRNIAILNQHTEIIRQSAGYPIFSPTDIFSEDLYSQLEEIKWPLETRREAFITFWQGVFKEVYITDIFMTPRWEDSEGAKDEHRMAQEMGIRIHYVDNVVG